MLGVNNKAIREENDFYATDPYAIDKSIRFFEEIELSDNLWEPACGQLHLSCRLKDYGYNVVSSDLVKRNDYCIKLDFLQSTKMLENSEDIITNPPFKLASDFVKKSMELLNYGRLAVFLLKIQFLETETGAELFKNCGLKYVGAFSNRICCAMNGEFDKYFKQDKITGQYRGGTQCYAWFVFQKGYNGAPVLKFI